MDGLEPYVALRGRTGEALINAGWGKTAGKECKAKTSGSKKYPLKSVALVVQQKQ